MAKSWRLGRAKWRISAMEKRLRIKICPVCGSHEIRKASSLSGWFTPEAWVCPKCGYRGPVCAEMEVEKDKLGEEGRRAVRTLY